MLTPSQRAEFGSEPDAKQQRAKHTPGPWHVREDWTDGTGGDPPLPHPWITTGEEGYYHGETGQGFTLSGICSFADARLIAAAPDLLEALKALMSDIEAGLLVRDITRDGESGWSMQMLAFVRRLQTAQSAIAKAEARAALERAKL